MKIVWRIKVKSVNILYMRILTGIAGNLLKHYDTALYGLLAPTLAPLFFTDCDPITALILTYAILPVSIITKPLGCLVFGWIGDTRGRRQALSYSLIGIAVTSLLVGLLPTYQQIGPWAPIFLTILCMMQNFFAAAESTGGAIFTLEHTKTSKRTIVSSLYDLSTIAGVFLASLVVSYYTSTGCILQMWRTLFCFGAASAILGIILRLKAKESAEFVPSQKNSLQVLLEHKQALLCIAFASGLSHTTYTLSFTLMNGFLPIVSNVSLSESMQVNTSLLVLDMLGLVFFGFVANRFGTEKVMKLACIGIALCSCPIFYLFQQADLQLCILLRSLLVLLGTAFAAPYYAWAIGLVAAENRYTVLSIGASLGTLFIASPSSALSLWLYQETGFAAAPGFYLVFCAFLAYRAVERRRIEVRI